MCRIYEYMMIAYFIIDYHRLALKTVKINIKKKESKRKLPFLTRNVCLAFVWHHEIVQVRVEVSYYPISHSMPRPSTNTSHFAHIFGYLWSYLVYKSTWCYLISFSTVTSTHTQTRTQRKTNIWIVFLRLRRIWYIIYIFYRVYVSSVHVVANPQPLETAAVNAFAFSPVFVSHVNRSLELMIFKQININYNYT